MPDNPQHQGDVAKYWLTTPTLNVYGEIGTFANACLITPREGMPGSFKHTEYDEPSLFEFVTDWLEGTIGERFTSGVIEFDTGEQIRFEWVLPVKLDPYKTAEAQRRCEWKVRGSTYGGWWRDAAEVSDAILMHRAIVVYQTYRQESRDE